MFDTEFFVFLAMVWGLFWKLPGIWKGLIVLYFSHLWLKKANLFDDFEGYKKGFRSEITFFISCTSSIGVGWALELSTNLQDMVEIAIMGVMVAIFAMMGIEYNKRKTGVPPQLIKDVFSNISKKVNGEPKDDEKDKKDGNDDQKGA